MIETDRSTVHDAFYVQYRYASQKVTIHDIFRATILSRIQYAAPAWSGMCSAADSSRLESLLRRAKRLGYCAGDTLPASHPLSVSHNMTLINKTKFLSDADFIFIQMLYKYSY